MGDLSGVKLGDKIAIVSNGGILRIVGVANVGRMYIKADDNGALYSIKNGRRRGWSDVYARPFNAEDAAVYDDLAFRRSAVHRLGEQVQFEKLTSARLRAIEAVLDAPEERLPAILAAATGTAS